MDELDARLRAMAKREDWALPAAYESAMDGLEEQIRQGAPWTGLENGGWRSGCCSWRRRWQYWPVVLPWRRSAWAG